MSVKINPPLPLALNNAHIQIESFTFQDLPSVAGLQPDGWPDIFPSIQYYCKSDFCFPLKASISGEVVGIGTAIIHGQTAWLAHIIVNPLHRNSGVGSAITKALIDLCQKSSCRTLQLIATTLGEPVYKKYGFEVEAKYAFFGHEKFTAANEIPEITTFQGEHERAIFQLDCSVSGEDRKKLLREHLDGAQLFFGDHALEGFYMPTLGEGMIIADSPAAGLALMKLRAISTQKFCLPVLNEVAANFLSRHGFTEYRQASRMSLGEKVSWHPTKIYSRIGGNLG